MLSLRRIVRAAGRGGGGGGSEGGGGRGHWCACPCDKSAFRHFSSAPSRISASKLQLQSPELQFPRFISSKNAQDLGKPRLHLLVQR
jgi:hypothetical protein